MFSETVKRKQFWFGDDTINKQILAPFNNRLLIIFQINYKFDFTIKSGYLCPHNRYRAENWWHQKNHFSYIYPGGIYNWNNRNYFSLPQLLKNTLIYIILERYRRRLSSFDGDMSRGSHSGSLVISLHKVTKATFNLS